MTFNICIVTSDSKHERGAYLDLYIEEGLEYISKNQRNPRNRFHHALGLGYAANLSKPVQPTKWKCSNDLKYTVDKNGYYSIIMIAPILIYPADILFWYSVTFEYKVIDVIDLPPRDICNERITYNESHPCYLTIQSPEHVLITQHQCIIVEVLGTVDSDSFSNFGNFVIEYNSWYVGRNAFLGVGLSVLIITAFVIVLLVILMVCICRARAKNKRLNKPQDSVS